MHVHTIMIAISVLLGTPYFADIARACINQEREMEKIALDHRYPRLKNESRFPRVYFLLPRKLAGASFREVEQNVSALRQLKIEELWMSNENNQTTQDFFGSKNDHGYWPSDISIRNIDTLLGGSEGFHSLLRTLERNGIGYMPDAVVNHLGYNLNFEISYRNERGEVVRKKIQEGDDFFRRRDYDNAPDYVLYRPDQVTTQQEVIDAVNETSKYRLAGLPSYNHQKFDVREYLYHNYRERVDLGAKTIRVDACKHVPVDFLVEFTNRLNDYSQNRNGRNLKFVMEYLYFRYFTLDALADYFYDRSKGAEVYFFDYPLAAEVRSLANDSYGFHYFREFLRHRETGLRQHKRLVPILEDHDFLTPIRSSLSGVDSSFIRELAYTLSEFVSYNPTVLYHGGERSHPYDHDRPELKGINGQGDLGQAVARMSEGMDLIRSWPDNSHTDVHYADHNTLIASKSGKGGTVFAFLHRGQGRFDHRQAIPHLPADLNLSNIHSRGHTFAFNNKNGEIIFQSEGPSIDYFYIPHRYDQ